MRRALIVDEFVMQRARIEQLLTGIAGLEVVGVCNTIREFVEWLRHAERTRWPHLLVLGIPFDSWSPNDISALTALREAGIRVLALTTPTARMTARRVADAGAEGFITTADSEDDLVAAAEIVLRGGTIMTARAHAIIRVASEGTRLSAQEARVLALYAGGLTIGRAADVMGIRHDTARKYLNRVRDKFTSAGRPARSKLELAQIAWADGYAEPSLRQGPGIQQHLVSTRMPKSGGRSADSV
ncbi:DNA-binding response regulator [Microbacterium sp. LWH12-1.2]|uniref:DNA-binding response regulator n=1 Tax=Microbacterium sp. LWH12-1.2 TaxID=3135259 RepID=UPI00342D54FE